MSHSVTEQKDQGPRSWMTDINTVLCDPKSSAIAYI